MAALKSGVAQIPAATPGSCKLYNAAKANRFQELKQLVRAAVCDILSPGQMCPAVPACCPPACRHSAPDANLRCRHQLRDGHDPNSPEEVTPVGLYPLAPGSRNALHVAVIYGHADITAELSRSRHRP
eukprot:SAG22_NODE_2014_length_3140_cov_2.829990_3_plen_128_part_00